MKVITKLLNNEKFSSDLIVKKVNGKAKPIDYFQYGTTEQFTGEYDYRGKKIYSKTFVKSVESSVGAVKTVDFPTGIVNGELGWRDDSHSYYAFTKGNTDNLNMYNDPDRRFDAYFKNDSLSTYRIDFRGKGAGTCVLTLRYTKTTD